MSAMKRALAGVTMASVLAIGAMAPAAGADPWVEFRSEGQPLVDGGTATLGQPLEITGGSCDPSSGQAVMGQFTSAVDDPAFVGEEMQWKIELPVDELGSFDWSLAIPEENSVGTFYARWYCATAPVESLFDPEIVWVAPLATMTIEPAAPGAPLGAVRRTDFQVRATTGADLVRSGLAAVPGLRTAVAAATPEDTGTVGFELDPDALPLIDRVGIRGPEAAALKERVDADVRALEASRAALAARLGRTPLAEALRRPITDTEYVTLASVELTGRRPSTPVLRQHVTDLANGQLKVKVVEDLALAHRSVDWWTANA
jgi:hypothetical protein